MKAKYYNKDKKLWESEKETPYLSTGTDIAKKS